MAKTATGRGGRPLDVEATKAARTRHAEGRRILDRIFFVGSAKDTAIREATRRIVGGHGPEWGARHTRRNWTRPERRARGKAAKLARRANRGR